MPLTIKNKIGLNRGIRVLLTIKSKIGLNRGMRALLVNINKLQVYYNNI